MSAFGSEMLQYEMDLKKRGYFGDDILKTLVKRVYDVLSYLQRNKPGQQSGEANTKLPVDGWVQETLTAYQFHTCFISPLPMHQSRGDHRCRLVLRPS